MSDAARRTVLGAIRHHLREARSAGDELPAVREAGRGPPPRIGEREDLVREFATRLGAVGGVAWRVAGIDGAADCVASIAAELGATRIALSDAPLVRALRGRLPASATLVEVADRDAIASCELGITSAQAAIAETGTLVLDAGMERHRLASLLPRVHVALVPVELLVADLDAAFAAYATREVPAAITLVTGPSRTADIELTLVVGVHGPQALHVVLIDGA
ncbi:MAG: lactate utilization protein [Planctomycetes bacterium]|nr:lactate utilization protein [Planctomycetota bacterium]